MEEVLKKREAYQIEIALIERENEKRERRCKSNAEGEASGEPKIEVEPEPLEADKVSSKDLNESPNDYKVYEKCVELYETNRKEMQSTFSQHIKDKLSTNFTSATPSDRTGRFPGAFGTYSIIRRKSDVDKLKGLSKEAQKEVLNRPLNI